MNTLDIYFHGTLDDVPLALGTLAFKDGLAYFDLSAKAVELGLNISPFQLDITTNLQPAKPTPFHGLHGVFADSLPDGWGMLLMDRDLRRRGLNPHELSPLDRLSYIGDRALGALSYVPQSGDYNSDTMLSIPELADEATSVFVGNSTDVLDQLIIAGGSPGGARPKANIALKGDRAIAGQQHVQNGYEHWLVKFPTSHNGNERASGHIEYAYATMATDCGIRMPSTKLLASGREFDYFAVQRFDRNDNHRIHCHTLAGLIHADYRLPDCDYETLLRVTHKLTRSHEQTVASFRQMIFNIVVGNRDDHTKNFSFVLRPQTDTQSWEWELSPAYDLTYNTGINGHHSMAVAGHGQNIPRAAVDKLGALIGLKTKQIQVIIEEVAEAVTKWPQTAKELSIPPDLTIEIENYIQRQIKHLVTNG